MKKLLGKSRGFTMIELLVVIAVIGILAVALLATLNPLEQIRKGRDTRTRTNAAQLSSAIERYNASVGRFPWQDAEADNLAPGVADINWIDITTDDDAADPVLRLNLLGETSEVKAGFIEEVQDDASADIFAYFNDEDAGASVIMCFTPESNSFSQEAYNRCVDQSFGADFLVAYCDGGTAEDACPCPDSATPGNYVAGGFTTADADEMICLP